MTTITVGNHLVKPSEAFMQEEPMTSKIIANAKYKYFIPSILDTKIA